MPHRLACILLSVVTLWLAACNTPATATIPPSPIPLSVSFSPYLARIEDALHACALTLPESAVFFERTSGAAQDFEGHDLVIWWGEKPSAVDFAYPLGDDELVVVVNPENPKQELSPQELKALFSGHIESWTEIGTLNQQVTVWIFPEMNLLSELFKIEVLDEQRFSRLASVAPSPQAMLVAIAKKPGAIGFLPRSWISPEVSTIQIDPDLQDALRKPLIVLTKTEPKAGLQNLVTCLQTGAGQAILEENYFDPQ